MLRDLTESVQKIGLRMLNNAPLPEREALEVSILTEVRQTPE